MSFDVTSFLMGKTSGGVTMLTRAQWNSLSATQKQAYGLLAIQDANSGFDRGELVYGADYLAYGAMRTNYVAVSIPLTNWAVNFSHDWELMFKHNASPKTKGDWPAFLGVSGNMSNALAVEHNLYETRRAINFGWNNRYSGDGNYSYDTPYDYQNYYKLTKSGDAFEIWKATSLNGSLTKMAGGTLSGASADTAFASTASLFPPSGGTLDTNFYWFKVYDSSGHLLHDYRPIEDTTYSVVLHDLIDWTDYVPVNNGATFVSL